MRKIIFLDCDGVICMCDDYIRTGEFNHISYGLAERVREIMKETGAKLVLTSTWRKYLDWDHAFKVVKEFRQTSFYGVEDLNWPYTKAFTPYDYSKYKIRGEEIQAWLEKHMTDTEYRYVILDDDSDFLPHQKPFHIKTMNRKGLTEMQKEQAIQMLNS